MPLRPVGSNGGVSPHRARELQDGGGFLPPLFPLFEHSRELPLLAMSPQLWGLIKRSTHSRFHKMSPSKIPDEELREGSVDVLVADVPNVNGNHGLQRPSTSDVLVVGAGPAGLMLA